MNPNRSVIWPVVVLMVLAVTLLAAYSPPDHGPSMDRYVRLTALPGGNYDFGSGYLIDDRTVLTAGHVASADTDGNVFVALENGTWVKGKVFKFSDPDETQIRRHEPDLALIVLDKPLPDVRATPLRCRDYELGEELSTLTRLFGRTSTMLMKFYVMGYPEVDDASVYVDAHVWGGMSGSPVFDSSGAVAGVVWASVKGPDDGMMLPENSGIGLVTRPSEFCAWMEASR